MVINLKSVRSAFYFLGSLALLKSNGSTPVDLTDHDDSVILGIAVGLKNGTLSSEVDLTSLGQFIKDAAIKASFNEIAGIVEDVVEAVVEIIEEIVEPTPEPEVTQTVDDEEAEYLESLKELLDGNVKVVIDKLSNAALSDEDKLALIDFEQNDKNRKAVLTAINEL